MDDELCIQVNGMLFERLGEVIFVCDPRNPHIRRALTTGGFDGKQFKAGVVYTCNDSKSKSSAVFDSICERTIADLLAMLLQPA